jgi:hypothetical protein
MKPYLDSLTKRSWFRVLTKLVTALRRERCNSSAHVTASEADPLQFSRKRSQLSAVGPESFAVMSKTPTCCSGRFGRLFMLSAGVIFLVTGVAKVVSASGNARILDSSDPVFSISFRHLFLLVGLLELAVGSVPRVVKILRWWLVQPRESVAVVKTKRNQPTPWNTKY